MKTVQKRKIFIGFCLGALVFLLLLVTATPLIIQHRISVTPGFIIEEESLETLLIINQLELLFILYRAGFLHQQAFTCSTTTTRSSEASKAFATDVNRDSERT